MFLFINFDTLTRSLEELGVALIIKMVLEMGVLSLGPHICCFRPLVLNHISKVRAGPCAAYTAETRQSGERERERSGIRVLFIPQWSHRSCRAIVQWEDDWQEDERWGGGGSRFISPYHPITVCKLGEGRVDYPNTAEHISEMFCYFKITPITWSTLRGLIEYTDKWNIW